MKKINQSKLIIFFIVTSFFFAGLAEGLMYFGIFISNFYKKKYIDPLVIFLISIFWDAYSYAFVGISLAQLAIFYLLSRKYRIAFQSFKINTGFLFLFLCCAKLFSFMLVSFLGYSYDIHSNGIQIFYALSIHLIYYFFHVMREDARHV
ncbi:MAG: hypothetical protein LBG04_00915 [Holosporaceae bacterium]|jgi:hypothetical protein|nr:hypothetical protein [Holosporaceae bacterium]